MFNFAEATKDMTAAETLNYYRNLYYAEPQVTERGIVANAINDYFKEVAPRAEVAMEIFEEIDTMIFGTIIPNDCAIISIAKLAELKKKYTGGQE